MALKNIRVFSKMSTLVNCDKGRRENKYLIVISHACTDKFGPLASCFENPGVNSGDEEMTWIIMDPFNT